MDFNPDTILAGVPAYAGATEGEWKLKHEEVDMQKCGGYGVPTIMQHARVIIPEHFDTEANDDIDDVQFRIEPNARLCADAKRNAALVVVLARALDSSCVTFEHVVKNAESGTAIKAIAEDGLKYAREALATYKAQFEATNQTRGG